MPKLGFRNNGFSIPHFIFGGIAKDGSVIEGIAGSNLTEDTFLHNATISSPVFTYDGESFRCWKLFCSGTLTLNTGGTLNCNGDFDGSPWLSGSGEAGFVGDIGGGSLGGSGGGGDGNTTGNGVDGGRVDFGGLGGAGGNGHAYGVHTGGAGGTPLLGVYNNLFQSTIYETGTLFTIVAENNILSQVPIFGGGGGGGAGDSGGHAGESGGAAGGGVIYIAADRLVMNGGTIDVKGGGVDPSSGGGGGGGGAVIIVANELIWADSSSYIQTTGGAGFFGNSGSSGTVLIFTNDVVAAFSGNVTKTQYNAARIKYNLKGKLIGS